MLLEEEEEEAMISYVTKSMLDKLFMSYVLCVTTDINIVTFGQTAIGCERMGSYCVFMHVEGKLMMIYS